MSSAEKVVGVTGGSGYIASWLIKILLHRGYVVRATVRDPCKKKFPFFTLCSFSLLGHCQAVGRNKKKELLKFDNSYEVCGNRFVSAKPSCYCFSLRERRILVASLVLCCRLPSNLSICLRKFKSFCILFDFVGGAARLNHRSDSAFLIYYNSRVGFAQVNRGNSSCSTYAFLTIDATNVSSEGACKFLNFNQLNRDFLFLCVCNSRPK